MIFWFVLGFCALQSFAWHSIPYQSQITKTQPMTGIALWADAGSENLHHEVQLEFRYLRYADVVQQENQWDWSLVESTLNDIASRGHQAILRFYDVYPNQPSGVPDYILLRSDYRDTTAQCEGHLTQFPDWGNLVFQDFILEFYRQFFSRYQQDPRLAFLEVGFGLWGEYHIYDGPMILGRTFPDLAYQEVFLRTLDSIHSSLPWSISIDAASEWAPFQVKPELLSLSFGNFDDSFLNANMLGYNQESWLFFGNDRWKTSYAGGEFSYYNTNDQQNALVSNGPNGLSFAQAAHDFHISFIIGADQPQYRTWSEIQQASLATGYHFRLTALDGEGNQTRMRITNTGVAPVYRDVWPAIGGVRASISLKGLLPGDTLLISIDKAFVADSFALSSDHLVTGQYIEIEANLTTPVSMQSHSSSTFFEQEQCFSLLGRRSKCL